ncbi:hypothetical protein OHB24_30155 [Kribbella sp. NBC_00482]|uniref:hypothetical protein n=1 Tax=Kribbella sp. NBC_00482 TaxID=2975968 RepID=UPI002E17C945
MPPEQILATLVALAGAVLVTSLWKQLLTLVLVGIVLIFCVGLYNVAVVVAG